MNNRICQKCGTENEADYKFCKNCGFNLGEAEQLEEAAVNSSVKENTTTDSSNFNGQSTGYFYSGMTIDGIPADEVAFFIGKKSNSIIPKMIKMEITRTKTSWCWPAAVLGFLFGPLGSALWFFYRKMYKIALILLAIGTVTTFFLTAFYPAQNTETLEKALEAFLLQGSGALAEYNINISALALAGVVSAIENAIHITTGVLTGIFGFRYYKEHIVSKIRTFRQNIPDQRYYRVGIASIGGVSGGMLAVGIISLITINNLAESLTLLL